MSEPTVPAADKTTIDETAGAALLAGELELAETLARSAIESGQATFTTWEVLVRTLRWQGRHLEARAIQEFLVENLPGQLGLRFDLAETLLLLGEFDRGWREYHYRYSLPHTYVLDRKMQRPAWNGQPIAGKTLLIHDEQGYGDTFQFLRLASWAKQRSGARVVLQINHDQASFARRMPDIDQVILRGAVPPPFDVHCQLMSLPRAMKLKMDDLPGPVPYLAADKKRLTHWEARLKHLPRPLVALVWAGSETHGNDANRSMRLSTLAPLGSTGATLISIQKGPRAVEAETPPEGMHIENLSQEITDFDDTAAILEVCDLLISVDSSPVHLAGALARPAWLMLPYVPDWRWLLEREDSPWYPNMRLFRQTKRADWSDVIERMAAELTTMVLSSITLPRS